MLVLHCSKELGPYIIHRNDSAEYFLVLFWDKRCRILLIEGNGGPKKLILRDRSECNFKSYKKIIYEIDKFRGQTFFSFLAEFFLIIYIIG